MNFFAGRTPFDIFKICAYGAAILGGLTAAFLQPLLAPWGVSQVEINTLAARVGSVALALGFIASTANVFKNPSPPVGQAAVHAPVGAQPPIAPEELSTTTATKGD
jgi:hypothetical protein